MNKKVLTLCAGALLSSMAVGTVSAAHTHFEYRRPLVTAQVALAPAVSQIDTTKWYQLRVPMTNLPGKATGMLIQTRDPQTGKVYLRVVPQSQVPLLPSLWKIVYTPNADGVSGGHWTFINKETNLELSFDHTFAATKDTPSVTHDNAVVESCNTTWEWYNTNEQTSPFGYVAPYAYTDSEKAGEEVMCMRVTDNGLVYSYVGTHKEIINNDAVVNFAGDAALMIQPVLAEDIVLTPSDFNSMIDFNKPGHAQNGEFKFFYPNGNAMDTEVLTGFENNNAMAPDQMYHAAYDDISAIYEMALEQEGIKENVAGKQEAVETAWNEYTTAEDALKTALSNYTVALTEKNALDLKIQADEKIIPVHVAEMTNKYSDAVEEAVGTIIGTYNSEIKYFDKNPRTFAEVLNSKFLVEKEEVEVDAVKQALDNAINAYEAEKADGVKQIILGKAVAEAASAYFSCFEEAGSDVTGGGSYRNAWKEMSAAITEKVATCTDKDLALYIYNYEQLQENLANDKAALEDATAQVGSLLIIYDNSREASATKRLAWINAKRDLEAAIGNQNAYNRTKYILDEGYMRLKLVEDNGVDVSAKNQYLMVDTTFWQSHTVPSRADLKMINKTPDSRERAAIAARYFFKLTYYPSQDSIVVEPLNASAISDQEYNNNVKWVNSYAGKWFVWENESENGSQPSNTFTRTPDNSNLPIVVKLTKDAATDGAALTAGSANKESDSWLKTRIAFNNPYDYLKRYTLAEGLYFIKGLNNGKYVVANFAGDLQYDVPEDGTQDYTNMPATMFVVKKAGCKNGDRVAIYNREYGWEGPAFYGQLYIHEEDGSIFFMNERDYVKEIGKVNTNYPTNRTVLSYIDDYVIEPVPAGEAWTSDKHGYKFIGVDSLKYTEYAFNYNSALNKNVYLNVDEEGYLTYNGEGIDTQFELDTVYPAVESSDINYASATHAFGYGAGVAGLPQLKRQAYVLKQRDVNLVDNDTTYVALVQEPGKNAYYKAMGIKDIRAGKGLMAQFYLKSDQIDADGNEYYALIDIRSNKFYPVYLNGARQLNCTDSNGKVSHVDLNNEPQERASAFRLVSDNRPLYREVNDETINLFNNSGEKMIEEIAEGKAYNYLSFANDNSKNGALEVERLALDNDRMPQYLLGVAKDSVADGYWCENNTHGYFATVEEADAADKNHYVAYNGYTSGRFLVNFVDSVLPGSHAYNKPDEYTHRGVAVRLGFVEGVHMVVTADEAKNINDFLGTEVKAGEYFFTLVGGHTLADLKNEQGYIIPERLFSDKYTEMNAYTSGKHNNWSFSFRLIDETNPEEFLIESNLPEVSAIGSMEGAWIKDYNGCPVVSYIDGNHSTIEAVGDLKKDNVTDGEIFTLEATNETATANEEISANGEVSVVATDGAVIVKGAEGKNVVVSTILGKVVANEVLNSDNETIAAPAGIVVVSVDGESFKVAVK